MLQIFQFARLRAEHKDKLFVLRNQRLSSPRNGDGVVPWFCCRHLGLWNSGVSAQLRPGATIAQISSHFLYSHMILASIHGRRWCNRQLRCCPSEDPFESCRSDNSKRCSTLCWSYSKGLCRASLKFVDSQACSVPGEKCGTTTQDRSCKEPSIFCLRVSFSSVRLENSNLNLQKGPGTLWPRSKYLVNFNFYNWLMGPWQFFSPCV